MSKPFARPDSIVRRIWADEDMVLLVFSGAAAEFALNKAVDWLFFTGKIPKDPIGRLFSTAAYSKEIVFADEESAQRAFKTINAAHASVEQRRGAKIPEWAYRDVLYMLIDYSERAHEILERPLKAAERDDLYDVFYRVGVGLNVKALPATYVEWKHDRDAHLEQDLAHGEGTDALYTAYREHLGAWRCQLLLEIQSVLVPPRVRQLLELRPAPWMKPLLRLYSVAVQVGLRPLIQQMFMPQRYLSELRKAG